MPARFRAPVEPGAVLAEPPTDRIGELVEQNRRALDRGDARIDGSPLPEFRVQASRELGISPDAPLLIAGHQPELSHPGVWVKNFALCGAARKLRGTSLNLIVDNDTLKSTALRVPTGLGAGPEAVHLQSVPFDHFTGEEPYETYKIRDEELFATFADRVQALTTNWGFEPLLTKLWPDVVAHSAPTIGERFSAARQQWERAWGCENLELPVSRLSQSTAFRRFVHHLAADTGRFRSVYNAAVRDYRQKHGIRSRSHPVPELQDGEAPFWVVEPGAARRPWFPAREPAPTTLRPRALSLTLFARVCLGDFFIHGIGGGKYDEVTDTIIRHFFDIAPPAYQVLSATLHLPVPTFPTTTMELKRLERDARDLVWNPHRHLPASHPLIEAKTRVAATEPMTRSARRAWYTELRRLTDQLRPEIAEPLAAVESQLSRARTEAAANAEMQRRDFSWVLFPEAMLKAYLQPFCNLPAD